MGVATAAADGSAVVSGGVALRFWCLGFRDGILLVQIPLAETEVVGVCSAAVELREAFVRLRIRGFAQRLVWR